jgi:hypothetical protein
MIAKAPIDVRAVPAPRPAGRGRPPVYKDPLFWVIAGGLFVATVVVTIVVTRPRPEPYTGNTSPYVFQFP